MPSLIIDTMTSIGGVELVLVSPAPFDGVVIPPSNMVTWCPLCYFSSVDLLLGKRKTEVPKCYGNRACNGGKGVIWIPKDYYEKRKGDWEKCTTKS